MPNLFLLFHLYLRLLTAPYLRLAQSSARIPCVVATDKEAIQMCIRTCNGIEQNNPRVIRIPNSLHIGQIMLSRAYYEDVKAGKWSGLEAVSQPEELRFDPEGALLTPIRG